MNIEQNETIATATATATLNVIVLKKYLATITTKITSLAIELSSSFHHYIDFTLTLVQHILDNQPF